MLIVTRDDVNEYMKSEYTQASELYRQNQLLKQQNEKITKQKGQLIQMSKKVQELNRKGVFLSSNMYTT